MRFRRLALISFVTTMAAVEIAARAIEPSLPPQPRKWSRVELDLKYEQMRAMSEKGREVPVIFAGSSMMASGIDPNVFTEAAGVESYNAGVAGTGMTALRPWTMEVAKPLLSFDTVVLGIQSRELNDESPVLANFYNALVGSPGFNLAVPRNVSDHIESWLDATSAFFRNRRSFRSPMTMFEVRDQRNFLIGPRGVRRQTARFYRHKLTLGDREGGVPFRNPGPLDLAPPGAFGIGGSQMAALEAMAVELNREDMNLVVLVMPVTRDYELAFQPIRQRFFAALDRLARKHAVTVIDAQDAFPRQGPFRDPIHLDVEGRVALSAAIGEEWSEMERDGGYFRVVCDDVPRCRVRKLTRLEPSDELTPGRRHAYLTQQPDEQRSTP
jgi:hypothetical protein